MYNEIFEKKSLKKDGFSNKKTVFSEYFFCKMYRTKSFLIDVLHHKQPTHSFMTNTDNKKHEIPLLSNNFHRNFIMLRVRTYHIYHKPEQY